MNCAKITEPQRRALEWLPADGSWRAQPGSLFPAVESARYAGLAERELGAFGARGGTMYRYRLTTKGKAAKDTPHD